MGIISDSHEQTRLSYFFFFSIQAYLILLHFTLLQFTDTAFFFSHKLKFCGNFQSRKLAQFSNLPTAFAHFMSQ